MAVTQADVFVAVHLREIADLARVGDEVHIVCKGPYELKL